MGRESKRADHLARRREIIRTLFYAGKTEQEIADRLTGEKYQFFPPTYSLRDKLSTIRADLTVILREDDKKFTVTKENADSALVQYINRQKYLYNKAVESSEFELAVKISKDIARAQGVSTDSPTKVDNNSLVDLMQEASRKAREKQQALAKEKGTVSIPEPSTVQ